MLSVVLLALALVINYVSGYGWQWADYPPKTPGSFYGTAPSCNGHCDTPNIYLWFSGLSEGDGSLCTSGSKVYCNTAPDPWASTVWKGTAPSCNAKCSDCAPGYCIATDQAGDGAVCATGRKALCGATGPPAISDMKLVNTTEIEMGFIFKVNDDKQLSLISSGDNHNLLIESIIQVLGDSGIPADHADVTAVGQTSVRGILINNSSDYLVNVKFNYDTVINAEIAMEFLSFLQTDDPSFLINQNLPLHSIYSEFVEVGIGNEYIFNQ